jgi:hypothetical protein
VRGELERAVARRSWRKARERQPARRAATSPKNASNGAAGSSAANAWPANSPSGTRGRWSDAAGSRARLLEARHEGHAAGEVEAARVVAAADLLGAARRAHEQVAAVRADVRQAAQRAVAVAREQQRLVEVPRQQRRAATATRRGDVAEIAEPLPGAREDALARRRMDRGSR